VKWIGQHIWDFVSRFRNELFLESLGSGTPANFLSVDSTNKVISGGKAASLTESGIIELATTGEADAGIDAVRAVTPAGLKSHVDSKYSYQYITFTFKVTSYAENTWVSPTTNGPEYYLWGSQNSYKIGATQAASDNPGDVDANTTLSIDYLDQGTGGFVIPAASQFCGFYGNMKANGITPTTARPVFGIFKLDSDDLTDRKNTDTTATVIAFDKYDTSSGVNMKNRFLKVESIITPVDLAAGDILIPAAGLDVDMDNSNGYFWGNFTLILRTKLI
tara:strand:+ start:202 stop:1029 length:828 start_codon:yes stop_codon:yes gene_type:complete